MLKTVHRIVKGSLGNLGKNSHMCNFYLASVTSSRQFITDSSQPLHIQQRQADCETQEDIEDKFKQAMRKVPQPVVVVTTGCHDRKTNTWKKRGVTCSSFTSVSVHPPIVSVCMTLTSRMNSFMKDTEHFAVHVLARDQVRCAVHFAKQHNDDQDQFETVPHFQSQCGIPILEGTTAVLHCKSHCGNIIGDHQVWYGEVLDTAMENREEEPLLYYGRKFRCVGDETFMAAFENQTLPFEDWTHESHIRMAYNYILKHGKDEATPLIKEGIKKYNERNKEKISRGYHETVTIFYIHMIDNAIQNTKRSEGKIGSSFDNFIHHNLYLLEGDLLFRYYSRKAINSRVSEREYVPPDIMALP